MSTSYPGALDTFAALVDNTDTVVAAHPNNRGDSIEQLQIKLGVDSSAVATSHDYLLTHLPAQDQNWDAGAYEVRAQTLESDVATGTAPIAVASTTLVSNLNVEKLNSQVGSYYLNIANTTITSEAQGDILYYTGSAWARLGTGTAGQLLKSGGAGANPSWTTATTPSGALTMWSGAIASPPTGWLICDGSAVSRTTYSDLFSVVSTIYGVGNGSTTFNLPQMTNRFPYGASEGSASGNASVGGKKDSTDLSGNDSAVTNTRGNANVCVAGGNTCANSVDVMPPYLAIAFIIKT